MLPFTQTEKELFQLLELYISTQLMFWFGLSSGGTSDDATKNPTPLTTMTLFTHWTALRIYFWHFKKRNDRRRLVQVTVATLLLHDEEEPDRVGNEAKRRLDHPNEGFTGKRRRMSPPRAATNDQEMSHDSAFND